MIPNFLKPPLFGSATVAAVTTALPIVDPEVFRTAALSWIAIISVVICAAIGAVSQAIPLVFGLLEKFDRYAAERAARRGAGASPKAVVTVDVPVANQNGKDPEPTVHG